MMGRMRILRTPDERSEKAQPNRDAWDVLRTWGRPFLVAFSDRDPITGAMAPLFADLIPGARGIEHPTIEGAGHFLREDDGERLGHAIAAFVQETPWPTRPLRRQPSHRRPYSGTRLGQCRPTRPGQPCPAI